MSRSRTHAILRPRPVEARSVAQNRNEHRSAKDSHAQGETEQPFVGAVGVGGAADERKVGLRLTGCLEAPKVTPADERDVAPLSEADISVALGGRELGIPGAQ